MTANILFFDSGVGGLSVYQETVKGYPNANYLYCLDNGAFPYSEKSESFLIDRIEMICKKIAEKIDLDCIVIACNTASTVCLPRLRQTFSFPIVGTVPAIKPAAEISETKHIALVATKGTVQRQSVNDLIQQFATHCQVEKLGSTLLVEMAEEKLQGNPVNWNDLEKHLMLLRSLKDLDTVVLGCTHFPFLEQELRTALPQVKHFIHSGKAISQRIADLLMLDEEKSSAPRIEKKLLFSTAPLSPEKQQIFTALGFGKSEVI